jgi:hypothetical protein
MTRKKAFLIHLALSASVGLAVIAAMLLVWYPPPYFIATGGNDVVMILVGVDVVLGPLITLVVFNPAKALRLIRLDLAVIAVLQLGALAYGIHVVAIARPVYMVFTVDRFDLVLANDLRDEELARVTDPRFKGVPWDGPRVIGVKIPANPDEQLRIITSAGKGYDLQTFPQYYVPFEDVQADALKRSRPLERLRSTHPDDAAAIDAEVKKLARTLADTNYLPLKGKAHDYSVLLDGKSGAIVGYVKVSPW